jgi:hypothetical protein
MRRIYAATNAVFATLVRATVPRAEGSRTGLPLRATARPMLPKQPAALHWARAPRQPGVARSAPWWRAASSACEATAWRGVARRARARAQATAGTARRDAVRVRTAWRQRRGEPGVRRASPVQCCRLFRQHWPSGRPKDTGPPRSGQCKPPRSGQCKPPRSGQCKPPRSGQCKQRLGAVGEGQRTLLDDSRCAANVWIEAAIGG